MIISVKFPNPILNPNRKNGHHWSVAKKAKDEAKKEGYFKSVKYKGFAKKGDMEMKITFFVPDRRKRDLDNLHASMKPYLDGISQALGVDDSRFRPVILDKQYEGRARSRVEIEIYE